MLLHLLRVGLAARRALRSPVAHLLALAAMAQGCGGVVGMAGDSAPIASRLGYTQTLPIKARWRAELVSSPIFKDNVHEHAAAAYAPDSDRVIIGTSAGTMTCLAGATGARLWQRDLGGSINGQAVLDGDRVLVGTDDGALTALSVNDGSVLWSYQVQGAISEAPVLTNELAIFVDGSNGVYAVERATGAWRWQYRRDPPAEFSLAGEARPTFADGRVFVGFSDGVLVALAATDGAVLWTRDLAPDHEKFQDVDAPAVVAGGKVYAASAAAGLYALDPASGEVRWTAPVNGILKLAEADGDLIASLESSIVRLSGDAGRVLWRARFGDTGAPGQVAISGRYLAVGVTKGAFHVLNVDSGQPLAHWAPGQGVSAPPVAAKDGSFFVLSNGGVLYALRP